MLKPSELRLTHENLVQLSKTYSPFAGKGKVKVDKLICLPTVTIEKGLIKSGNIKLAYSKLDGNDENTKKFNGELSSLSDANSGNSNVLDTHVAGTALIAMYLRYAGCRNKDAPSILKTISNEHTLIDHVTNEMGITPDHFDF